MAMTSPCKKATVSAGGDSWITLYVVMASDEAMVSVAAELSREEDVLWSGV